MAEHTFTKWLQFEVNAARCALLKLIEEEDRIRYIEGPQLERAYMEAVGNYEETVVQEEMECELLTTKQRLVQAAINRREEIDEAAIDEKIESLRKDMTTAAAGTPPPQAYADLSPEQSDELQELYSRIIKNFHPGMHPEMAQAHKELYDKAQEAYRRRDLQALNLIWEMLTASDGEGIEIAFDLVLGEGSSEEGKTPERDYSTDYSLVSTLYTSFIPLQEEVSIMEEWENYKAKTTQKMECIQHLQQEFPYNAKEMLGNSEQLAAYKRELEQRMRQARTEREQLTNDIRKMIGSAKQHG